MLSILCGRLNMLHNRLNTRYQITSEGYLLVLLLDLERKYLRIFKAVTCFLLFNSLVPKSLEY